jgi:addiction module HigA family antidote
MNGNNGLTAMGEKSTNQYRPDYTVHPGEVIAYEMELRQMSVAELVQCSGMTEYDVSQLLQGKKEITLDVATKLSKALNMPEEYWLNLERQL